MTGTSHLPHLRHDAYLVAEMGPVDIDRDFLIDEGLCSRIDAVNFIPTDSSASGRYIAKSHEHWEKAAAICGDCPVRLPCLAFAVLSRHEDDTKFGVWGGHTPAARTRIREAVKTQTSTLR